MSDAVDIEGFSVIELIKVTTNRLDSQSDLFADDTGVGHRLCILFVNKCE